ncbi:rhomboid family intramembrane serine protease [Bacillus megaterium]|nr:rhomboid family intramembrane serine protease [Priestia megaterium]
MFHDAGNVRSLVRLYPVVSIVLSAHIVLWILFVLPLTALEPVWQYIIGTNGAIRNGEYWRLISLLVLHYDFNHMAANSLSLWLFGPWLERALGKGSFTLYRGRRRQYRHRIASSADVQPCRASGAIFALFGMYSYLALFRRDLSPQSTPNCY